MRNYKFKFGDKVKSTYNSGGYAGQIGTIVYCRKGFQGESNSYEVIFELLDKEYETQVCDIYEQFLEIEPMDKTKIELKPCPFCAREVQIIFDTHYALDGFYHSGNCPLKDARLILGKCGDMTVEQCAEKWNTRAWGN